MSRIGNNPIIIPDGVTASQDNNHVIIKGKLGELSQRINPIIKVDITDQQIVLKRFSENKEDMLSKASESIKTISRKAPKAIENVIKSLNAKYDENMMPRQGVEARI